MNNAVGWEVRSKRWVILDVWGTVFLCTRYNDSGIDLIVLNICDCYCHSVCVTPNMRHTRLVENNGLLP